MHEYTHAVVGKVTPPLRITDKADFNDARRQHDCYLRLLRELNVDVVELDLGGTFPGNVILEDVAIICHGIALLPKPVESGDEYKVGTLNLFPKKIPFIITYWTNISKYNNIYCNLP